MYIYIGIEDLVANALIGLAEQQIRRVSLSTLANYGTVIVKLLSQSGQDAIMLVTKASTYDFVHDYAEFFSIGSYGNTEYIELRDGITATDLRRQFRKNLTVDIARVLLRQEPLDVLRNCEAIQCAK